MESAEDVVGRELASGERLLWSGRPPRGLQLRGIDLYLVPFGLCWTAFAVFALRSPNAPIAVPIADANSAVLHEDATQLGTEARDAGAARSSARVPETPANPAKSASSATAAPAKNARTVAASSASGSVLPFGALKKVSASASLSQFLNRVLR